MCSKTGTHTKPTEWGGLVVLHTAVSVEPETVSVHSPQIFTEFVNINRHTPTKHLS